MINAYEQLKALKIDNYRDIAAYLKNKQCIVIGNSSSHNYGVNGTQFVVKGAMIDSYILSSNGYVNRKMTNEGLSMPNINGRGGNSICFRDFKIGGNTIKDIEEENEMLEKSIKSTKDNINDNILKIKFMYDNKLTTFDNTEFEVYKALSVLEDPSLSKIEKAKALSNIINNK